jgi:hypothetical protein
MTTHSGNGWTVLDTACYADKPGVHDIGARLGVTTNTMLLVILHAAERWVPHKVLTADTAIIRRRGRILVEFADGSTRKYHDDAQLLTSPRPPAAVVNVGTDLAELLVITAI